MKEFCKLNLTFSQDEKGVGCSGSVHFEGTGMDKVYVLTNICKALEVSCLDFITCIAPEVMKTLRAMEVRDDRTE